MPFEFAQQMINKCKSCPTTKWRQCKYFFLIITVLLKKFSYVCTRVHLLQRDGLYWLNKKPPHYINEMYQTVLITAKLALSINLLSKVSK